MLLNRPRQDSQIDVDLLRALKSHLFARPQPPHLLDAVKHYLFTVCKILRCQNEITRMPARGESHFNSSRRKIVYDRPLLRDANRIVQRKHDASRTQTDPFGDHCQRSSQDGRIRVKPSEVQKVPLRRPDSSETVPVTITCAFKQQPILVSSGCRAVVREEKETEAHLVLSFVVPARHILFR